jgi:hypothetical protein
MKSILKRYTIALGFLFALSFLSSFVPCGGQAHVGDTLRVSVFNDYYWKDRGIRDEGGLFPPNYRKFSKMFMRFTLAAPKDTSAGRWDYTMRVFVVRNHGDSERIEIGRFITPYGGWYREPWRHTWTMDVTPFACLLHDSVDVRVEYDGYSQGSLFSLDFDLVEGKPPYTPYRVEKLWDGAFIYGDSAKPISKTLTPGKVLIDPDADIVLLRIFTTGHGFGTDGAAEFTDKTHHIAIDGTTRFTQHLWRTDCGQNPLYPQAGTWYYSRGGWCPGDIVRPWDFNITEYVKAGDTAKIAYLMAAYKNLDKAPANYLISAVLIYAKGPTYNTDAAAEDIISPSSIYEHRRVNPICSRDTEQVVIRNWGKNDLNSVTINYGLDANLSNAYVWRGHLKFMDTAVVALPGIELPEGQQRYFSIHLEKPNDQEDENPANDILSVPYESSKTFVSPLGLQLQVDKVIPQDSVKNSIVYDLYAENGEHLYHNAGFHDSEFVFDRFDLTPGCYHFIIQDTGMSQSGGDGLYPIFKGSSPGFFTLTDQRGDTLWNATKKNRLANFGPYEIVTFNITADSSLRPRVLVQSVTPPKIKIEPRASGQLTVDLSGVFLLGSEYLVFGIYDVLDHVVMSKEIDPRDPRKFTVNMQGNPSGTYYARVESKGVHASEKFQWHEAK